MADDFLDPNEPEDDDSPEGESVEVVESDPEPAKAAPKPADKAEVKAKPIKARGPAKAVLPGLVGRGGDELFGKTPKADEKRFTDKHRAKDAAAAKPDEGEPEEEDDDLIKRPPGEAAPPKVEIPVKEAAPAKFKFADREYETQEQAEQAHRSLQGMFKPLQEKAELSQHNARAAEAWMNVVKEVLAGTAAPQTVAQLRQQLGVVAAPPVRGHHSAAGAQPSNDILSDVDMGAFATIAADPEGGLEVAGKYLVEEVLRVVQEKLLPQHREQIRGEYQPLLADEERRAFVQSTEALLENVANYNHPGESEPAFPELRDPVAVEAIGKLWAEAGNPLEDLASPKGLIQAVANYRLLHRVRPASGASNLPPATVTSRPAPGAAASLSDVSRGTGAGTPRAPKTGLAGLLESLDDPTMIDTGLGFKRNRRVRGVE